MFKVRHKHEKELVKTVYAVTDDERGFWLLTYEDNEWVWLDADNYEPVDK